MDLPPGRAELWYELEEDATPERLAACRALLSPDETARLERFVFDHSKAEFALAHGLLRRILSRYADVPPERWAFVIDEWGRPDVSGPPGAPRLRFNLTHTRGLVACLVALEAEVGVDAEDATKDMAFEQVAESFFSDEEARALAGVPPSARRRRFYEYWTLKEAYIKARGRGLAIDLKAFAFRLPEGAPIAARFDASLEDDPASWRFRLHYPTPRHVLATAVRRPGGRDIGVELKKAQNAG